LPRIDVPAVLLGRITVDLSVPGRGLGPWLLIDAPTGIEILSDTSGTDSCHSPTFRIYIDLSLSVIRQLGLRSP